MRKLWRWATVGMGTAVLVAGLAVTATSAGATTHIRVQVTQSQRHLLTPASCTSARNYKGGYVTVTYCDGAYNRYACSGSNSENIYGPLYAANGCSTQVNLYLSTTDKTPLCINPNSSTNVLKQDYKLFVITHRTGNC
jgi:hypothetical protein